MKCILEKMKKCRHKNYKKTCITGAEYFFEIACTRNKLLVKVSAGLRLAAELTIAQFQVRIHPVDV